MTTRWYVLRTKPQQELLATHHLREQGFDVYVAKRYQREFVGHRMHPTPSLRFQGYIFVAFDKDLQEHGPITNTRGVAELLCDREGNPKPLEHEIIAQLRQCEDEELEGATRRVRRGRSDLRLGDLVQIDQGPCAGQTGPLLAILRGIASVLVGSIRVTIVDCDISAVDDGNQRRTPAA